jgi:hypothetical protein
MMRRGAVDIEAAQAAPRDQGAFVTLCLGRQDDWMESGQRDCDTKKYKTRLSHSHIDLVSYGSGSIKMCDLPGSISHSPTIL